MGFSRLKDEGSGFRWHCRAGLDPGDDAAMAVPTLGAVAGLGIVALDGVLALSALDRAGIGCSAALLGKPNT